MYSGSLALAGCAFWGMSMAESHFELCIGWGAANFILAAPWAGMLLCAKPHFGEQFSIEQFVAHECATKGTCGIIGE